MCNHVTKHFRILLKSILPWYGKEQIFRQQQHILLNSHHYCFCYASRFSQWKSIVSPSRWIVFCFCGLENCTSVIMSYTSTMTSSWLTSMVRNEFDIIAISMLISTMMAMAWYTMNNISPMISVMNGVLKFSLMSFLLVRPNSDQNNVTNVFSSLQWMTELQHCAKQLEQRDIFNVAPFGIQLYIRG